MRDDDVHLEPDELRGELGEAVVLPLGKAKFDGDVPAFDVAQVAQSLPECIDARGPRRSRGHTEKPDAWNTLGRRLGEAMEWPPRERGHRNQELPASGAIHGASPFEPAE